MAKELKPKKFIEMSLEVKEIKNIETKGSNDRQVSRLILSDVESGTKITVERPGLEKFNLPINQSIAVIMADTQMKLTDVED